MLALNNQINGVIESNNNKYNDLKKSELPREPKKDSHGIIILENEYGEGWAKCVNCGQLKGNVIDNGVHPIWHRDCDKSCNAVWRNNEPIMEDWELARFLHDEAEYNRVYGYDEYDEVDRYEEYGEVDRYEEYDEYYEIKNLMHEIREYYEEKQYKNLMREIRQFYEENNDV